MKTVQMWRNETYPEELISCLSQTIKTVGRDNYTLLCNNQSLADILEVESLNFDKEYYRILAKIDNPRWWRDYCTMNMYRADMIRLYYAKETPDLFYLDADISLYSLPDFTNPDLPYLVDGDFCMFYVNGRTDWFNQILDDVLKTTAKPMAIYNYLMKHKYPSCRIKPSCYDRKDFGTKWKI